MKISKLKNHDFLLCGNLFKRGLKLRTERIRCH